MLSIFNLLTLLLPGGLLALLVTGSPPDPVSLAEVRQTFEESKIPTDAHLAFDPIVLFDIVFPQPAGATPVYVTKPGTQLAQNVTAGPPQFALHHSESASTSGPFVIAAVDLDAPTPQTPTVAQFRHFIGGGYYPDDVAQSPQRRTLRGMRIRSPDPALANLKLVNETPAITEFLQPRPPQGSDPHRYVFLVYEESPDFSSQTIVNSSTSRLSFNVSTFAAATGLGDPLGGTFILVGSDP